MSMPTVPGTVSLLSLSAVARAGPLHGFQILRWIRDVSEGELLLEEGALYPALHRMEHDGWLTSEWATSEKGRRAKYYRITAVGKRALRRKSREWGRYVSAVARVAAATGEA